MKQSAMLVMVMALLCFAVSLPAQEQIFDDGTGPARLGNKEGIPLSEMNLTEDQSRKIEDIGGNYGEQILKLRSRLTVKQIELKSLLRDPKARQDKILSIAQDIRVLTVQIQKKMIQYQLDIRKVLTPEQIKTWCTLENPSPKRGRRQ
jgi:Spy/CpxP family protein refolding chaperone